MTSCLLSHIGISLLLLSFRNVSSSFSSRLLNIRKSQRRSRFALENRSFSRNRHVSIDKPDWRTSSTKNNHENEKFGLTQRVESVKCLAIGGLSGSIAMAPISALRNAIISGSLSQWEFDTDMGSLEAGLFGIVYRYCLREDENPQLSSGCVGAFVIVRTLSRIETSNSCSAIPLACKCKEYRLFC